MSGSKLAPVLTWLQNFKATLHQKLAEPFKAAARAKLAVIRYIKARLAERGTWASIGAGVTGAAALSPPWDYVFVAVALVGVLVPSA
jgi:hypothetical protein